MAAQSFSSAGRCALCPLPACARALITSQRRGTPRAAENDGAVDEPRLRYGAHTDYDGFTILQRASSQGPDGLEIQAANGTWEPVPSPPGTLTINIGDLLARWTNDRWRATRHRVAPAPRANGGRHSASSGRLSIVYFTGPHPDTIVKCLPCAKCSEHPPKYKPITAYEHVVAKMEAATAAARQAD